MTPKNKFDITFNKGQDPNGRDGLGSGNASVPKSAPSGGGAVSWHLDYK